jgi:SPP1 gp7 family putative phage head morphogenesis protein
MLRRRKPATILRPVHANAGVEAQYRRKLIRLINAMYVDVRDRIRRLYGDHEPAILAMDAVPADILAKAVKAMTARWQAEWDALSWDMANWFATDVDERTMYAMKAALKKGGYAIRFQKTPAMNDILAATVNQNVGLIKSIPAQFLGEVEGLVMRSVQSGRDLEQLTKDLRARYQITRRRAELIARDQNNKATSALRAAREKEAGVEEGVWLHSGGGKEPRPKHVAANGKRFKLSEGLPVGDDGGFVMPGQEINCRCTWRAVVPGFS